MPRVSATRKTIWRPQTRPIRGPLPRMQAPCHYNIVECMCSTLRKGCAALSEVPLLTVLHHTTWALPGALCQVDDAHMECPTAAGDETTIPHSPKIGGTQTTPAPIPHDLATRAHACRSGSAVAALVEEYHGAGDRKDREEDGAALQVTGKIAQANQTKTLQHTSLHSGQRSQKRSYGIHVLLAPAWCRAQRW
jgi:hypothetical protein